MINEGWVCPKCGRVLAPNTMYCLWCCSGRGATTNTASGTPESYLAKSLRYSQDGHEIEKTESNSEKPNNCEHITEDGVTCAKYPACDDCPDNPLNKVKGSERLVKGSEQTEPTISKMEQVDEPQTETKTETQNSNLTFEKADEPQTDNLFTDKDGDVWEWRGDAWYCISGDEPQTERSE